jgi:carboxypeptidase Q
MEKQVKISLKCFCRGVSLMVLLLVIAAGAPGQENASGHTADLILDSLITTGLRAGRAYEMLRALTDAAPHRLSGSPGAAAAVELTQQFMNDLGFDRVHREEVMVPRWTRGNVEKAAIVSSRVVGTVPLTVCALGGSIATPPLGLVSGVVEVHSFEELRSMGRRAEGKIVFFNRPFSPTKLDTFDGYSGAVDQRVRGAIEAAKAGAVAALVRSVTTSNDDVPHTGMMRYEDGTRKIPAAALSITAATLLSDLLRHEPDASVSLELSCRTLPDVPSANLVGELTGSVFPHEIILVGGHLDAWDKGSGAHDDGAGCVQAIEALRLLKTIGFTPKRTIRAVMFINEENGLRGGKAYPASTMRQGEHHIAALESDRGGFAPRGLAVDGDSLFLPKIIGWRPLFERIGAGHIVGGGSGVDISPLVELGTPGIGLLPETHRYFDYHHSDNDTIDKVNERELEMGAIVEALLCCLLSEQGI